MKQTLDEMSLDMLKEIPRNFETLIELIRKSSSIYGGFGGEVEFRNYLDNITDTEYKWIIKIFKDLIGNDSFNNLIEMREIVHPNNFERDFHKALEIFNDFKKPHKLLTTDNTNDPLYDAKNYLKENFSKNNVAMIYSIPDFLFAIELLKEYPNIFKHIIFKGILHSDSMFYLNKENGDLIEADLNEKGQIVYAGLAELTSDVINAKNVFIYSYTDKSVLN